LKEFYSGEKAKEYLKSKSFNSTFHDWVMEAVEYDNRSKAKEQLELLLERFKSLVGTVVFSDLVAPVIYPIAESKGMVAIATQFLPGAYRLNSF
jgi:hypothetical protein